MFKDLSPYMLRHNLNVQIPQAEKNMRLNSFFRKATSLWHALPVVVKSSSFSSFKLRLETFYCDSKGNCWHLHGSNPRSISLRCRLRLRLRSQYPEFEPTYLSLVLTWRQRNRRAFTSCTLHSVFRVDLLQSVNQFCWKKACKNYSHV